jgi:hypothetical protein
VFVGMALFTACADFDMSFKARCKTSDDGFVYYIDRKIGLCIIALPDSEDVVIPEFIDGKEVKQLGYKDIGIGFMETHTVDGSKVKKLTIRHTMDYFSVRFPNLEKLILVDFLYYFIDKDYDTTIVGNYIGWSNSNDKADTKVELTSSKRQSDLNSLSLRTVIIPEYVIAIDEHTFSGTSVLILKTIYESKPDGWADGWNGDNQVEWGAEV